MAMIDMQSREAQEIDELLPWYEKGTLSSAEMRRVSAYLQAHPEMPYRLSLIREELAETVSANESLGMPSASARDRLFAAIAAEASAKPGALSAAKAWWRNLLPDGMSPRLGLAAAAACLVIALLSTALITVTLIPRNGDHRLAVGGDAAQAQPGSYVFVRFTDDAKASEIAVLLKGFNAVIVDGPKPGGVFKIRIADRALTDEERMATIQKLRDKTDIISFAAPAG
jgi:hypothetical protein